MKLFIGVHHAPPTGPGGVGIIMGTQALFHDFVMGPKYPATHAFVVVETEGLHWALDGKPPHSEWSPVSLVGGRAVSEYYVIRPQVQALWQITGGDVVQGIKGTRLMNAVKYDWTEIGAAAAAAFSILPGLHKFKMLGNVDLMNDAMICTHVAVQAMKAVGGDVAHSVALMPDLYPERLAQVLRASENQWCRRVTP